QSLDICMFRPLSTAYSKELSNFVYNCQGISYIAKESHLAHIQPSLEIIIQG
ncbi:hypothetical protein GQ43DRAFT_364973, partial [Delitschia confertaspora ATCC 74209]